MESLPLWLKSLLGCGVMVFIFIQGFRLTSVNNSKTSTKTESSKTENKEK